MARILVPFDGSAAGEYALDMACTMAAIDGDEVCAVYVFRVPPQLPISAYVPAEHARAEQLFERAHAIANRYQASLTTMMVEARHLGPAIVEAAQGCACVIFGQRAQRRFVRRWLGSRTLRYLVAHAPCQVLVGYTPSAGEPAATQQFLLVHGAAREHAAGENAAGTVLRPQEHRRPAAGSEHR
jgi:nucleotide-binding universal stress UspA family protein